MYVSQKRSQTQNTKVTKKDEKKKTYNIRNSLVVTDPTTILTVLGLTKGRADGIPYFPRLMVVRESVDEHLGL